MKKSLVLALIFVLALEVRGLPQGKEDIITPKRDIPVPVDDADLRNTTEENDEPVEPNQARGEKLPDHDPRVHPVLLDNSTTVSESNVTNTTSSTTESTSEASTSGNVTSSSSTTPTTNSTTVSTSTSTSTETSTGSSTTTPVIISTTEAPAPSGRGFDGWSFFGGIILTLVLIAIAFVGMKYYKIRRGQGSSNYNRF